MKSGASCFKVLSRWSKKYSISNLLILCLTVLMLLAISLNRAARVSAIQVSQSSIKQFERARLSDNVRVHATGRGYPTINLSDGRDMITAFSGPDELRQALEQNRARPLSLATTDYDEDGMPDLVCGYGYDGRGIVTILRGNQDSVYPNSPEAQQRRAEGTFTDAPFLSPALVFEAPEAASFIGSGDFDGDGHQDLVVAARGSNRLHLLSGDGRGRLADAIQIDLPGGVTAMQTGEINRRDGLEDLVVAVASVDGSKALVFEGPEGALRGGYEAFDLTAPATSLALGQLNGEYPMDLAIAAGNELLIVYGRDRKLSLDEKRQAEVLPARLSRQSVPFTIASVAIGAFAKETSPEVALLSTSGGLHILRPGGMKKQRRGGMSRWQMRTGIDVSETPQTMISSRVSSRPGEDLIVIDSIASQLHIVTGDADTTSATLDISGRPVAALPMRLNGDALKDMVVLNADTSMPSIVTTQPVATFTVTNTNNSGQGSFVQAITDANNSQGADIITFNIGMGVATITPPNLLPTITEAVTIDGTTQPGFAGTPLIELNGASITSGEGALIITGGNSTVRGLVINRYSQTLLFGIYVLTSGGNVIEGNFIGTDPTGTINLGNALGVSIGGAINNQIGGTAASARNLISGNNIRGIEISSSGATGNLVQGNLIGTDVNGTADLGNTFEGIVIANTSNNTVGGTSAGACNVISGNNTQGILISASDGNLVQGNLIGTSIAGTAALGNSIHGVLNLAPDNTIGGTTVSARNIISGNTEKGVGVTTAGMAGNLVQGNFIGVSITGAEPLGNQKIGVESGAPGSSIGGATSGAGNVISGNGQIGISVVANNNTIQGNIIGLDSTGMGGLMGPPVNNSRGIDIASGITGTQIGGTAVGAGNVISGNLGVGIFLNSSVSSTVIGGNIIGLDITGEVDLGNLGEGIQLNGANNNTVGGPGFGNRNIISGNNGSNGGVLITGGGTANLIQANFIGTDKDGQTDLGNTGNGVFINNSPGNSIRGNLISGNNSHGVRISGSNATGNLVQDNAIGITVNVTQLGNTGSGVLISSSASNNLIGGTMSGEGNVIAFNGSSGVAIDSGTGNAVRVHAGGTSYFFSNAGLGIDLGADGVTQNDTGDGDSGANGLQNFPVLTLASTTEIQGRLNSAANASYTIQFFLNTANVGCDPSGFGEGQGLIGSTVVTPDSGGNATFSFTPPNTLTVGDTITAIATDPSGNTSEFSRCIQVSCLTSCTASSPGSAATGESVPFTANLSFSCQASPAFNWQFGDNTSSSLQNPSHVYTAPGVYNWTLTVSINGSTICIRTGTISIATPTPVIDSFSPAGGPPGTVVTIRGLNFNGATAVSFNNLNASFTLISSSEITATVPAGATTGPISVQATGGTATTQQSFVVSAVTITVNSSADTNSRDNALTLREAILVANGALAKAALSVGEQFQVVGTPTGPSLDQIRFSIGTGPQTISVGSSGLGSLPAITGPVVIDGTTQPGFLNSPIIELNGTGAGAGASGLQVSGGQSTVRGLVINRFSGDGILLQSLGGNLVAGNFIGTGLSGNSDLGNGRHGVNILQSSDNVIGGIELPSRNVISGNGGRGVSIAGDRNRVQGNLIGVGQDGVTAIGNDLDGVSFFGRDNSIGARLNSDGTVSGLLVSGTRPGGGDPETSNMIAFNQTGVRGLESMTGGESNGNSILSNLIHSNDTSQIQLQSSCSSSDCTPPPPANSGQPAPILDSATFDEKTGTLTITGRLIADPNTDYFLEFFRFDMCPGGMPSSLPQRITSLPILQRTDSVGFVGFSIPIPLATPLSGFVNATATDPSSNTSPFSLCVEINGGCSFAITPDSLSFPPEGGTNGVTVTTGSGCAWTAMSNNPEFITITSGSSGSGLGSVIYTVAANSTMSPRTGTMTIAGQTFTVTQNGLSCSFSIAPLNQSFGSEGGAGNVVVTAGAGCGWAAVSNNPEFITITSPVSGGGSGNGMVSFIASASTGSPRMGTMTIAGNTFTVMQGSGCTFTITPTNQSFAASAAVGSVNVIAGAGCGWTAVSNNPEVVTVTSGDSGSGTGTVSYLISANPSASPRTGTITVAGQTFTVMQGAAFLDVAPGNPFFTEIGKLSARGVTLGCGGGNYCPDQPVTRDQMAAFIIRARGELMPPPPAMQRFGDVPPSNIFYAFIDRMAVLQITLGCGGGNYCPSDPVTREQMAAFIIRGLSIFNPPAPAMQRFGDVPPSNIFYAFIEEMAVRRITLGCGGGNYCPTQSVTRDQMAAFLVRAFNL